MIKLWWHRLTTKRIDLKYLSYVNANNLMANDPRWEIAGEENHNNVIGFVFLELRE